MLKTHEMINDLEGRGFSAQQAEAIIEWQIKIAESVFEPKAEFNDLKMALKKIEGHFIFMIFAAQIGGALLIAGLLKLLL